MCSLTAVLLLISVSWGDFEFLDAISREFTYQNDLSSRTVEFGDAVSREFTYQNDLSSQTVEFTDAVSREFTYQNDTDSRSVEFTDAVSREFTYQNDESCQTAEFTDAISREFTYFNNPVAIAVIADASIPAGVPYTSPAPSVTHGAPPITWSLVSGPADMTMPDSATGFVTWPNPTVDGNPYTITIQATNAGGSDQKSWKLTVVPAAAISQATAVARSTSCTITWTTDLPATSQVEYGTTDQYGSATTLDANQVTAHSVIISNLTPNTTYHFRVKSKNVCDTETVSTDATFATPQACDLAGNMAVVGGFAVVGHPFDISWTASNFGPGATLVSSWTDRVILSDSNTYGSGNQRTLGDVSYSGGVLPTGQSYDAFFQAALQAGDVGQRYVFLSLDVQGQLDETSRTNNILGPYPVMIQAAPAADLQVSSISVPSTGTAGRTLVVNWTVLNLGTGVTSTNSGVPVDSWADRIVLTTHSALGNPDDRLLAQVPHAGSIAAGANYTVSTTVQLPQDLAAGDWHVFVVADSNNNVYENTREDNNARQADNLISIALPAGDTTGPYVVSQTPSGTITAPFSAIDLTFSEPVNLTTVSAGDVQVAGPAGPILVTGVTATDSSNIVLRVTFASQATDGNYAIRVGPYIADLSGNWMDQNANHVCAEQPDDLYQAAITLQQYVDTTGPKVLSYTPTQVHDVLRQVDVTFSEPIDGSSVHYADATLTDPNQGIIHAMGAQYQGNNVYRYFFDEQTVNGTYILTILPTATDTAGNLMDQNGSGTGGQNPADVFTGPIVVSIPPDVTGPYVEGFGPTAGYSTQPIDHIDVGFSEPIRFDGSASQSTFAAEDVTLTGPAGAVAVTQIEQLDPHVFRVHFAPQSAIGIYTFTAGPGIEDRSGNLMDQDRNGANGEDPADRYSGTFQVLDGEDHQGPVVVSVAPGSAYQGLDGIDVTFSEAIDATTLSAVDFKILAPGGSEIGVTAISAIGSRSFHASFLRQTLLGDYSITIGPAIADASPAHNLMDQNRNGTNGEPADVYARTIHVYGLPDLAVSSFSGPTIAQAGHAVTLSYTVANIGNDALYSGNWTDQVVLSQDGTLGNADDVILDSRDASGSIAKGGSYSRDVVVTLPASAFGNYTLLVVTDTAGTIQEVNESNNASPRPLTVRRKDLGITPGSISFAPTAPGVGTPFVVSAVVRNYGDSDLTTDVSFYDGDPAGGGALIGTVTDVAVPASGSATATAPAYSSEVQGSHAITVVLVNIQPEDDVATNNQAVRQVVVGPPGYELTVSLSNMQAWRGASLTVAASVRNTGANAITITGVHTDGTAGAWLTPDTVLAGQTLEPNESRIVLLALDVPADLTLSQDPEAFAATLTVETMAGPFSDPASVEVSAAPKGVLNLTVLQKGTNTPLPNTMVALEDQPATYLTDGNGLVSIPVQPGPIHILAYAQHHFPRAEPFEAQGNTNAYTMYLTPGEPLQVQSVTVRPLTGQEVLDRGVNITDPVNNWVFDFEIRLQVEPIVVTVELPVNPPPGTEVAFTQVVGGASGGGYTVSGTIHYYSPTVRTETWIIIPGDVRYLKQFFDVTAIIKNNSESPDPSLITIQDTQATLVLPDGIGLPDLFGQPQSLTQILGNNGVIQAGEMAQATWTIRGDKPGKYQATVNASGRLEPFHVDLTATGTSEDFEVAEPTIGLRFQGPKLVWKDHAFGLDIAVTNTSPVPVYFVRVGLDAIHMVNAHLAEGESVSRDIGTLQPGQSQTVHYQIVSEVTGLVTFEQMLYDQVGRSGAAATPLLLMMNPADLSVPTVPAGRFVPGQTMTVTGSQSGATVNILPFAGDVGDSMADACVTDLTQGSADIGQEIGDSPQTDRDVDMYQLNIDWPSLRLRVNLDATEPGSPLTAYVRVFDAAGQEIAASTTGTDPNTGFAGDPYLDIPLTPGTYYVGVSTTANTDYDPSTAGSGSSAAGGPYVMHLALIGATRPAAPVLGTATAMTIRLLSLGNSFPSTMEHAVRDEVTGLYVGPDGRLQPAAFWQLRDAWANTLIRGLQPATTYRLASQARNAFGTQSAFGPVAVAATTHAGDVNGDHYVNVGDLQALVSAWAAAWGEANYNAAADLNSDGYVNVGDLQVLVANWGAPN